LVDHVCYPPNSKPNTGFIYAAFKNFVLRKTCPMNDKAQYWHMKKIKIKLIIEPNQKDFNEIILLRSRAVVVITYIYMFLWLYHLVFI
jgi:hypothetical protein